MKIQSQDVLGILIATGVPLRTAMDFCNWHRANPSVWQMFEAKALELISQGKKHWGAKAIIEVIRYERGKNEGGQFGDYAVNNNYPSYYARVFAIKYPQHKEFFEFREIRGLKSAA